MFEIKAKQNLQQLFGGGGQGQVGHLGGLGGQAPVQNQFQNPLNLLSTPQIQQQIKAEADEMKRYFTNNPYELNNILESNPMLGSAILSDDNTELIEILTKKKQEEMSKRQQDFQNNMKLNSDGFNVEYQKQIEKKINEERLDKEM